MVLGKVLIVENDDRVRETVSLTLMQGGYEIVQAADGVQAINTMILAETQSQPIQAVICDLGLPGLSGNEVIAFLRAKLPKLPIIVLTGKPDVRGAVSLFEQGVVDYLLKPAQSQTLLDSVRRAIDEQALLW